jgi:hypothetical protein
MAGAYISDSTGWLAIGLALFVILYVLIRLLTHRH